MVSRLFRLRCRFERWLNGAYSCWSASNTVAQVTGEVSTAVRAMSLVPVTVAKRAMRAMVSRVPAGVREDGVMTRRRIWGLLGVVTCTGRGRARSWVVSVVSV